MRKWPVIKYRFLSLALLLSAAGCSRPPEQNGNFSFAFMTDIHLKPGVENIFKTALDSANKRNVDFMLTGGDLVFDVLRGDKPYADSLFRLYKETSALFKGPVYNCIGNHELFGIYQESGIDSTHPDYSYRMYERHLGRTYYAFDHKGWHFIVLRSVDENPDAGTKGLKHHRYIGIIDEEQQEWLKKDLASLAPETPIVLTTHIPFFSTFRQATHTGEPDPPLPNELFVANRHEILRLFEGHNLKAALHGHYHWLEDVYLYGKTHFIVGGAVSGNSWREPKHVGKGFLVCKIKDGNFSWEYIRYAD